MRQWIHSRWRFLFGDSARAFGTLSAVLLACLAIAAGQDHFREWTRYQGRYLALIRSRREAVPLERRFHPGLQQTWLAEIGVVDRCGTCHLGLKEASLSDVQTQPFQPHPLMPHSLTEFGCVMCHRGQGAATTVEGAHHSTPAWEQPILPARYLESACGQCHWNAMAGTPRLNLGRKLLARFDCVACHTIMTPDRWRLAPATDAPLLTRVGAKTTREWIFAWLKNPQAYATSATMPNFQLVDADVRDISAFLIAQSTSYTPVAQAAALPVDAAAGASLYGESFCTSCHATTNPAGMLVGGDVGPELTRAGSKVKPDWLADWLKNPKNYRPDAAMPHYRFDRKQITLLAGFLAARADSDLLANVRLEPYTQEEVTHGKALVIARGCTACHEINGIQKPKNFAPELTAIGSQPLVKILFAPGVPHTLPDYISAKIRKPHAVGPATKMPQFTLAPAQVDALVTALLAQTDRAQSLPAALRVSARRESTYQPAGKAGRLMADMSCLRCHTINGHGGDVAPDLTLEGSAVQRKWLINFLQHPNTLRPALIRRMPRFNVTGAEAETIADYILTVYQTPAFNSEEVDAAGFQSVEAEQGKQLFYSKYACQSCHIIDAQSDRGYIGPTLTHVGARLSAAWIFHWLKDPQALRPETIEPNRQMNDTAARALTAFLMRQNRAAVEK